MAAIPYLTGRKTAGFRRPRVGGWAVLTAGAGLFFSALLDIVDVGGAALLPPACLVLLGLLLLARSGPVSRFPRHRV
ncbi:hypothetical protein OHT52_11785 [Streptomyces sp. NBC_00247]|uniref:hypothetical protein n=1 Tax=Streptomyces sp. NBC_00247 TaxID=2975689 RepID=UPI002E27FC8C|nr:hypothetical protein [Streptomyces sp. NBC_00247]